MRPSRRNLRVNHWSVAVPIGEKLQDKRFALAALEDKLMHEGLGDSSHPIYRQAKAYPYEDISPYFRMVDEEVRQRGERAKAQDGAKVALAEAEARSKAWTEWHPDAKSNGHCHGCGARRNGSLFCHQLCWEVWNRRARAEAAFAELGRIVGEHAGSHLLTGTTNEYEAYDRGWRPKYGSYKPAHAGLAGWLAPVLTETAPAKADRVSPFTEGAMRWWKNAHMEADGECEHVMCGARIDEGPGRWSVWCCDKHFEEKKRGGG